MRTSKGTEAMGHGGEGDPSMGGAAPVKTSEAKDAMSWEAFAAGGPWREWWAGLGTVTAAFEGFGLLGFEAKDVGGKCLFLYVWSTLASSCI